MKYVASGLALLLFAASSTSCTLMPNPAPLVPEDRTFRIVAFATDAIVAESIPYNQLTHINYSFLIPNTDGSFAPLNNGWKLEKIVESAHGKNVKVNIAVGGWGWDAQFEQMASDPESRQSFITNLTAIVNEYQLDGVDIDWEYPDPGVSSDNFLALMKLLREALPDQLISTAVIAYGDEHGLGILREAFLLMDQANVMTYDGDGHGSMAQFQAGLKYWIARGLPKEKINMGVPLYSRPDEVPYFKLIQFDLAAAQMDAFAYYGVTQNYNGIPTIQFKTRLAMQDAGGIMFWALDHDAQGEYSLVNAIHEEVNKGP